MALRHLILLSSEFSGLCNFSSLELKWPSEASNSTWISVMPTFFPQRVTAVVRTGRRAVRNLALLSAGGVLALHPAAISLVKKRDDWRFLKRALHGLGKGQRLLFLLPGLASHPPRHGSLQGILQQGHQPQGKVSWGASAALRWIAFCSSVPVR